MTSARVKPRAGGHAVSPKHRHHLLRWVAATCLLVLGDAAAQARTLEIIMERGALTLCANPNALPFASKSGPMPGFQVELGEKIAQQLGVRLTREWVISAIQYRRADCDLVLNQQHKDTPLRSIPAFDNDPDFQWNVAAGLIRPDDKLRQRVDAAVEALLADGTIAAIYARYGIELRPPQ